MSGKVENQKTIFIHELYRCRDGATSSSARDKAVLNDIKLPAMSYKSVWPNDYLARDRGPLKMLMCDTVFSVAKSAKKLVSQCAIQTVKHAKPVVTCLARLARERLERWWWQRRTSRHGNSIVGVILTLVITFCISYVGINYQALGTRIIYWWGNEAKVAEAAQVEERLVSGNTEFYYIPRSKKLEAISFPISPIDDRIVIPRLGVNAPIVDSISLDEDQIMDDLEGGVVHVANTAYPGEVGNVFITGHSSYYPWARGGYKSVFALLDKLEHGDKIAMYHGGEKYIYQVVGQRIVSPADLGVLKQDSGEKKLTLMTCYPLGTNSKRLIVDAYQLDTNKA